MELAWLNQRARERAGQKKKRGFVKSSWYFFAYKERDSKYVTKAGPPILKKKEYAGIKERRVMVVRTKNKLHIVFFKNSKCIGLILSARKRNERYGYRC